MAHEIIEEYPTTFEDKLRLLMREHDDSKKDVMSSIGISASTLNYWLSGDRLPQAETLMLIAERYHVSTDWLLGVSGSTRFTEAESIHLAGTTLLSEKTINLLRCNSDEYVGDRRRNTIDFLLSNEYSGAFLDALATAVENLEESTNYPAAKGGLYDNSNTFFTQIPPNLNQESLNKQGYIAVQLSYYQEAQRCLQMAQMYLSNMFQAKENEIKNDLT